MKKSLSSEQGHGERQQPVPLHGAAIVLCCGAEVPTYAHPGYPLPASISASPDMQEVCKDAAVVFLASPSLYLMDTVKQLLTFPPFSIDTGTQSYPLIAVLTKGFIPDEQGEPHLIIEALENKLPDFYRDHLVYVAGPSHGEEVAAGLLVYSSLDIVGVQVCAATKNVIAIAFGLLDALIEGSDFFGDNTESLLLAAGLNEIQIIGRAMGATHPETFTSISGIGDLDVTCRSKYGRNRKFGREIITADILRPFTGIDDLMAHIGTIGYLPEGIAACYYLSKIAVKYDLKLPLCSGLYRMLNKELGYTEFLEDLLSGTKN